MKTFVCFLSFKIDVGENQRGNPEWRIQRHLQHWERVTQDEDKNKKQTNKQTNKQTKQNKTKQTKQKKKIIKKKKKKLFKKKKSFFGRFSIKVYKYFCLLH